LPLLNAPLKSIMEEQGICYSKSPFQTLSSFSDDDQSYNANEIYIWKMRLIYASIFHHQHEHAFAEARLRTNAKIVDTKQYQQEIQQHNISTFDYECPSAKFFVTALPGFGLGATIRQTAVNAILVGLAMNRTVLFINNVKGVEEYPPWTLAGCDRRDFQCFFRPVSPCVITEEQLKDAPVIATKFGHIKSIMQQIERGEQYPHQDENIVRMDHVNFNFLPVTNTILHKIHSISNHLIDQLEADNGSKSTLYTSIDVLHKAADTILDEGNLSLETNIGLFEGAQSSARHAIVMYILRPLQEHAAKIQKLVQNDIPYDTKSPGISLGLPIRSSDKCHRESECLTFPSYMNMMSKIYSTSKENSGGAEEILENKPTVTIFLTSELETIFDDKDRYLRNTSLLSELPFTPSFITHRADIHQGNGKMIKSMKRGFSPDDIMLSTMSVLHFQLYSQNTVGNCCSHFHALLFDFLRSGCGVSTKNQGKCMQSIGDPHFHVCCERRGNPICVRKRDEELKSIYGDPNVTLDNLQLKNW